MLLYCSAYYVVSNRFFKKRMWTFFSFFLSTLCVCVRRLSIQFELPPASLPLSHTAFLKGQKKKVNKWTIRSFFSQAFCLNCKSVWWRFRCFIFCFCYSTLSPFYFTCRVRLIVLLLSTPCNSNFGDFFNTFISFYYMLLYWRKVFNGIEKWPDRSGSSAQWPPS